MRAIAQRLARLERAAPRPAGAAESVSPPALPPPGEVAALVPQLARSLQASLECYKTLFGLAPQEAQAEADTVAQRAAAKTSQVPPEMLSWHDLELLYRADPAAALAKWVQAREAARDELHSGARGAAAVQPWDASPWWLARYFVVRDALAAGGEPRSGPEGVLIDLAAQAHCLLLSWQEELIGRTTIANAGSRREAQKDQPRLEDAQAIEQAMGMVERLHAMYLRTVRALQDVRRQSSRVIIRRAGQVNVGQQQVNFNVANGGSRPQLPQRG